MPPTPRPPLLHVWIPDYQSGKGGIQAFSIAFIHALREVMPEARLRIFSRNDQSLPAFNGAAAPLGFHFAGGFPSGIRSSVFAMQILRHALAERPDFILSTHVNFSPIARWLKRWCGIPYLAIAHGVDVWDKRDGRVVRALRNADRVLAVSRFTRERMLDEMALTPGNVTVLPNTFDADEFQPGPKPHYLLERHNLRADQPVILTVARLAGEERYKGYDRLIEALPAIRRAVPDVRYVLVGRGRDRVRIESMIQDIGVADAVTVAGYVPEHELRDYYNLCDVFAMPSKGEGFGIVFLEALACGKPVLAGDKDGSVDALCDGRLGVLIDPDDRAAIEQNLIDILLRRHSLKILREPDQLRAQVTAAFGFPQFTRTLGAQLQSLGLVGRENQKAESRKQKLKS